MSLRENQGVNTDSLLRQQPPIERRLSLHPVHMEFCLVDEILHGTWTRGDDGSVQRVAAEQRSRIPARVAAITAKVRAYRAKHDAADVDLLVNHLTRRFSVERWDPHLTWGYARRIAGLSNSDLRIKLPLTDDHTESAVIMAALEDAGNGYWGWRDGLKFARWKAARRLWRFNHRWVEHFMVMDECESGGYVRAIV